MKRILSLTVVTILFITALFYFTGYLVSGYYYGENEFIVEYRKNEVWEILTDIEKLNRGRSRVTNIKDIVTYKNLYAWTEELKYNGFRRYRQIERVEGEKLTIEMTESSTKMTGTWTFDIYESDQQTYVKITEKSHIDNNLLSGYLYYFGRDRETKEWEKFIKTRLFGLLLVKP